MPLSEETRRMIDLARARAQTMALLKRNAGVDPRYMLTDAERERLKRNARETIEYVRAEMAKRPRIDLDNLPPEDESK